MNFFEQQHRARSHSLLLLFLFVLAVVAVVIAVDLAALIIGDIVVSSQRFLPDGEFHYKVVYWASVITLGFLGVATLFKILDVARGGAAIAEMAGGRLIGSESKDPNERRLRNVVEEMAIASGIRVPDIYLLDSEMGINGFAAGKTPTDAVIAVTRGAIVELNRDELQGVVAHEFSHIFNGDMRLNLRLVGVLGGVMGLGILGLGTLRVLAYGSDGNEFRNHSSSSSSSSDDDGDKIVIGIWMGAIALTIIGYVGVFFGRMIKAAISREREFLADASALQYTRQPDGIGGALKKIYLMGSNLANVRAEQFSHFLFGQGFGQQGSVLATHPPIVERIKRIYPNFDPEVYREEARRLNKMATPRTADEVFDEIKAKAKQKATAPVLSPPKEKLGDSSIEWDTQSVMTSIGGLSFLGLETAQSILKGIPDSLLERCRSAPGAVSVVLGLVAADEDEARSKQLGGISDSYLRSQIEFMHREIHALGHGYQIPLLDLCLPALKKTTPEQKKQLRDLLKILIEADNEESIFEFCLSCILEKNLSGQRVQWFRFKGVRAVLPECQTVLAAMAYGGNADDAQAKKAYDAGMAALGVSDASPFPIRASISDRALLKQSLKRLEELVPLEKEKLIKASVATALCDGTVNIDEAELLRAFAEMLDCPMPPLGGEESKTLYSA